MNNAVKLYEAIAKHNVKTILDVGANVGQFAREVKSVFPNIFILSIEPNADCEQYLKAQGMTYIICCPSDSKTTKKFYRMKSDPIGTGHSLYKENSYHYDGDNLVIQEIQTDTLDAILNENLLGDFSFDLIKLDTQGSELDILKGCPKTLSRCKMVLAETDVGNYNQGCASRKEVVEFLSKNGFVQQEVIQNHISNGTIFQQDLLFVKEEIA
jgi:FkbM family methyltransferase